MRNNDKSIHIFLILIFYLDLDRSSFVKSMNDSKILKKRQNKNETILSKKYLVSNIFDKNSIEEIEKNKSFKSRELCILIQRRHWLHSIFLSARPETSHCRGKDHCTAGLDVLLVWIKLFHYIQVTTYFFLWPNSI